ncbi:hypothetical protein EDC04DRAFT_2835262 [Pisolithus marmoratus]|nr:hypothetical protein EDC04DRAFT_2835262 [Pisolithus marmoratus]
MWKCFAEVLPFGPLLTLPSHSFQVHLLPFSQLHLSCQCGGFGDSTGRLACFLHSVGGPASGLVSSRDMHLIAPFTLPRYPSPRANFPSIWRLQSHTTFPELTTRPYSPYSS